MRTKLRSSAKYFAGIVLGGLAGYLYYYFVGCASGACPISGNPYISTAYCAIIGVLLVSAFTPKKKPAQKEEES